MTSRLRAALLVNGVTFGKRFTIGAIVNLQGRRKQGGN